MPAAVPISRQWVIVLNNGNIIVDWGNNVFQDLVSGEFLTAVDQTGSRAVQDDDCSWLERSGYIQSFDSTQIYVYGLPERKKPFID